VRCSRRSKKKELFHHSLANANGFSLLTVMNCSPRCDYNEKLFNKRNECGGGLWEGAWWKKARFTSDMPCSPAIINCASNFSLFSGAFSLLPFRVRRRKLFLTHLQCERGQAEGERGGKKVFRCHCCTKGKHTPAVWDNLEMLFPFHNSSCLS
jgi:hypothetical protein